MVHQGISLKKCAQLWHTCTKCCANALQEVLTDRQTDRQYQIDYLSARMNGRLDILQLFILVAGFAGFLGWFKLCIIWILQITRGINQKK